MVPVDSPASIAWSLLRAGAHAESGLEVPTVPAEVATAAGPARMAVGTNGERGFCFPWAATMSRPR